MDGTITSRRPSWLGHKAITSIAFVFPFIFVSAYTPVGYISNVRYDFGSILRFIEHNFGIQEGALNFADARAKNNLHLFYNLNAAPRAFNDVTAKVAAFSGGPRTRQLCQPNILGADSPV